MKNNIALITGATSGFGEAMAWKFAAGGYDLIITGRRDDRLAKLKSEIEKKHGVEIRTLSFDVRDRFQVEEVLASLEDRWKKISLLVNNAGLAVGREPIQEGFVDDWERMIDTNLKGLLYVTRTVAPWMISEKKGLIINIGSIAGKEVYPGGNVYSATKFGVDALTRSMRIDLLQHGIKVAQIAPGAAETEFSIVRFKGDEEKAGLVYKGFQPLSADDIADAAWFIATRPPHVNINDMVIMPAAQAGALHIHKQGTGS